MGVQSSNGCAVQKLLENNDPNRFADFL